MEESFLAEIQALKACDEPSIRYRLLVDVLSEERSAPAALRLASEIKTAPRTRALLQNRDEQGRIPFHPYSKWLGSHWVLVHLADLGYPSGDESLVPLREQVLTWLLSESRLKAVPVIGARARRCASQEGNALYAMLRLGLADERADVLAEKLRHWQWPDGGWNCDRRPEAVNSSFMESLIPLRALALHHRLTANASSGEAARRAKEVFLKRRLYKRQADGSAICSDFTKLHYPCYWHYDILFGLKVMAEAGFISDARCEDAVRLLLSKRLVGGGFAREGKYYRLSPKRISGCESVGWGPHSSRCANPFVTLDALYVLKAAGMM